MVTSRSVWLAMEDNVIATKLAELARRHSKLASEYIVRFSPERREAI